MTYTGSPPPKRFDVIKKIIEYGRRIRHLEINAAYLANLSGGKDQIILNFPSNGAYNIVWGDATPILIGSVVTNGTGTLAYNYNGTSGITFTEGSPLELKFEDILIVTASGVSGGTFAVTLVQA